MGRLATAWGVRRMHTAHRRPTGTWVAGDTRQATGAHSTLRALGARGVDRRKLVAWREWAERRMSSAAAYAARARVTRCSAPARRPRRGHTVVNAAASAEVRHACARTHGAAENTHGVRRGRRFDDRSACTRDEHIFICATRARAVVHAGTAQTHRSSYTLADRTPTAPRRPPQAPHGEALARRHSTRRSSSTIGYAVNTTR